MLSLDTKRGFILSMGIHHSAWGHECQIHVMIIMNKPTLKVYDDVCKGLDEDKVMGVICLDFSKAFDSVNFVIQVGKGRFIIYNRNKLNIS